MKLWTVVAIIVVAACATYAAPIQTDDVREMLSEARLASYNYDIRTVFEKWVKGDIGLRKSFRDLAELIKGTKSKAEITADIREVFGSVSAVGTGLILMVRNAGVNVFYAFLNKVLGRDITPPIRQPNTLPAF